VSDESAGLPERDPRFPGGPWTGFYLQYWMPGRHTMALTLDWRDGEVTGEGSDKVGPFTIRGTYDAATGQCAWVKKYLGKHSVSYRGVADGTGIWGVWEIRLLWGLYQDRGGFHIWPEGTNVSEESDRTARAVLEAMHKEFGRFPLSPLTVLFALAAAVGLAYWVWSMFRS
jgi:hypothetical protein